MDLRHLSNVPESKDTWLTAFRGIEVTPEKSLSAGRKGKGSLWAYVHKPSPAVRRISIEMGDTVPAVIYLRIWIDDAAVDLYEKFRGTRPPTILGRPTVLFDNQSAPPNWEGSLSRAGVKVRGLRYNVGNLSFLNHPHSAAASLTQIGHEFCAWYAEVMGYQLQSSAGPAVIEYPSSVLLASTGKGDLDDVVEDIEPEDSIESDPRFDGLPPKTRQSLVNARVGQGTYRRRMLEIWGGCCAVTGCDIEQALIASHAKPWRECDVAECLDPYNGLPLVATLDRLFDAGLITFADDGRLTKHESISWERLERIGIRPTDRMRMVDQRHLRFLAAHREANGYSRIPS